MPDVGRAVRARLGMHIEHVLKDTGRPLGRIEAYSFDEVTYPAPLKSRYFDPRRQGME